VWARGPIFLHRAGTIIASMMVLMWFLSSFPAAPAGATGPAIDYSLAGMIGHFIHPFLAPVGFTWQIVIALIPGMAAREVAVAALGTVYAVGGNVAGSLVDTLAQQWSLATALSFLVWYVFAPQCMSTLAVVRRETGSWFWPGVMFAYMFTLAYAASFAVYHVAVLLGG
jgi:ferrous iron transport protein B